MGIKFEPTVNLTTIVALVGLIGGGLAIYVDNIKTDSHQDDVIAALTQSVESLNRTVSGLGSQITAINSFVASAAVQMKAMGERQDRFSDFARDINDKLSAVAVGIAEIRGRLNVPTSTIPPPNLLRRSG